MFLASSRVSICSSTSNAHVCAVVRVSIWLYPSPGRDGAARGLVCEGERWSIPREDELEKTLVSSRAEEQYDRSAVLQVQQGKGEGGRE